MKAAIRRVYGGPEKISVESVDKPIPNEGEILVKVIATTVNRTDCGVLIAKPYIMQFFTGLFSPKRPVLGTDFIGVVEEIKVANSDYAVGDRIMGFFDDGIQSQAEFVCINEKVPIIKVPDQIDDTTAICSIEGLHYAINFLNKVELNSEQTVMLNGGTGAIGSAAIQLCKKAGAYVVATCRKEHFEIVKNLGADEVIDYESVDFTKDSRKFDFVFDAVGKSTFPLCRKIMKPNAVYISSELGPAGQNPFFALTTSLLPGKKVKFPFPIDIQGSLEKAIELLQEGSFKPLVDKSYTLEEAKEAYEYVVSASKVGNVVLKI